MPRRFNTTVPMESAGRHPVMIRITKNSFFVFKESIRHRQRLQGDETNRSAAAISVLAGREWRKMNNEMKKPYRKLANIAKSKGRSFFISLEHLNTYTRYPDSIQFDETAMKMPPILNKLQVLTRNPTTGLSDEGTPKPDKMFGGYEDTNKS